MNGSAAHRRWDGTSHCGGKGHLAEGSPDVFIGEYNATRKKTSWIAISLVDLEGNPVPDVKYRIHTPDNVIIEGHLGKTGTARATGIEPGACRVSFPELPDDTWNSDDG
jgi:hypothetical protein